jgi:hypothetical protein
MLGWLRGQSGQIRGWIGNGGQKEEMSDEVMLPEGNAGAADKPHVCCIS